MTNQPSLPETTSANHAAFTFGPTEVRTYADDRGEPWFCAKDVCSVLGYANERDAVSKHCRTKGVAKRDTLTSGGQQEMTFINEGNLYRLIIKSRKPEAERFESWVMEEVLPTLRRTGSYTVPTTITPAQQNALQQVVARRTEKKGGLRAYVWSRFNNHFKLGSYKQLPAARFDEALAYLEAMPIKGQDNALPAAPDSLEQAALDAIRGTRWLVSLDWRGPGRHQMTPVPKDACIVTPDTVLEMLSELVSVDQIPSIITACAKRIEERNKPQRIAAA